MNICSIKLTHDSSVSYIKDGMLLFCVEFEKIKENPRHTKINDMKCIIEVFSLKKIDIHEVDLFCIDGWLRHSSDLGNENIIRKLKFGDYEYDIELAEYDYIDKKDLWSSVNRNSLFLGELFPYVSHSHMLGHIAAAYCTSPFSKEKQNSYILVWDGGMKPTLFYFDSQKDDFDFVGELFNFSGDVYSRFARSFSPFNKYERSFSLAGKVMAYISLGQVQDDLLQLYDEIFWNMPENSKQNEFAGDVWFCEQVQRLCPAKYNHKDILTSFHFYIQEKLVKRLEEVVLKDGRLKDNFCYSGGCALNIKWNSAIRDLHIFENIHIPPFPNDSGSSIGAGCIAMMKFDHIFHLNWNVYQGPDLAVDPLNAWIKSPCSLNKLATIIAERREPVLILNGKSEIGPRALGHRSIICDARDRSMKDTINNIKRREWFRPVAPICLEEDANQYFYPGTSDKYMLFEHKTWKRGHEVPAIIHVDGTARLQTVSFDDDPIMYILLLEYRKITGISVLCNTSANQVGIGFFSSLSEAMRWGKCKYIWTDGMLYSI